MRAALAVVLVLGQVAVAEPHPSADAHAKRGIALYNLGKYEQAIDEFELAYQEFPSDALLFNLAQAHRKLEHCDRALTYYHQFLAGTPAPTLVQQVEALLPDLEAACRTRDARPTGPVTTASAEPRAIAITAPAPEPAPAPAPLPATAFRVGASATAGFIISGATAPITGLRATALWRPAWAGAFELGLAGGIGQLWRDSMEGAVVAQLMVAAARGTTLEIGRITLEAGLGAELVSRLGGSSDAVPGVHRSGQWAPVVRAEVGFEHDLSASLAVRASFAAAVAPEVGALDAAIGELDLLLGVRYAP